MTDIKFYMNNPCIIIREITDEFVEIKLNPQYAKEMDGSDFCQGCILGSMDGAHPSHSCDDYDIIIDAINESEASIIVMAEKRLIQDKPVEVKKYEVLEKKLRDIQAEMNEAVKIKHEARVITAKYRAEKELIIKKTEILEKQRDIADSEKEKVLERLYEARKQYEQSLSLSSGKINISGGELSSLYKDSFVLESLYRNGVDNWEWYGEAIPRESDIEDYAAEMIRKT